MSLKIITLTSGVRCVLLPASKATDVGLTVALAGGSRYDTPDRQGLFHLLEHMLSHANDQHVTHRDFSAAIQRHARFFNAYTRGSALTFCFECAPKHIEACIRIAYHAICRPRFVTGDFTRQVQIVLGERLEDLDKPDTYVSERMQALAFRGHPLSNPTIGDLEQIQAQTITDLRRAHRRWVCGHRMAIALTGQFHVGRVARVLEATFGTLRPGGAAELLPYRSSQHRVRLQLISKPLEAVYLSLGFPTFGFDHPDRPILSLINYILGGQQWQSRLYQRLVVDEGLTYSALSGVWHEPDVGLVEICCAVRQAKVTRAVKVLVEELLRFRQERMSPGQLAEYVESYVRSMRMRGLGTLASFFAQQLLHVGRIIPDQVFVQAIREMTPADLQRVSRQVFRTDRANIAILGRVQRLKAQHITRCFTGLRNV